ncbi:DUF397 domain-containing protein [Streptomyces sp. 184]|uniref:DUF397 domain-containing protein n=1 Tax=Streptomyces sp. 184 TaxID=1827526 RepID=UPI0038924CAF
MRPSSTASPRTASTGPYVPTPTAALPVRDSQDPHGPAPIFDTAAWSSFVEAVKGRTVPHLSFRKPQLEIDSCQRYTSPGPGT